MAKLIKTVGTIVIITFLLSVNLAVGINNNTKNEESGDIATLTFKMLMYSEDTTVACVSTTFHFPDYKEDGEHDIFCINPKTGKLCGIEKKCEFEEGAGYCQQTVCDIEE
jgi:hypothetical protein